MESGLELFDVKFSSLPSTNTCEMNFSDYYSGVEVPGGERRHVDHWGESV